MYVLYDDALFSVFGLLCAKEGFSDSDWFAVFFVYYDDKISFLEFATVLPNSRSHHICSFADVGDSAHVNGDFGGMIQETVECKCGVQVSVCLNQSGFPI